MKQLQQEIEQLRQKLREAQNRQKELDEKIALLEYEVRKNAVAIKVHPRIRHPSKEMQGHGVIVHQGTLTPIEPSYYEGIRFPDGKIFIHFVRQGPSASEAFQPGSEFMKWIDDLEPKKDFVIFLVASDSFDSFRAAREELRRRKIDCGWEPHEDGNGNVLIDPSHGPSGPPPGLQ